MEYKQMTDFPPQHRKKGGSHVTSLPVKSVNEWPNFRPQNMKRKASDMDLWNLAKYYSRNQIVHLILGSKLYHGLYFYASPSPEKTRRDQSRCQKLCPICAVLSHFTRSAPPFVHSNRNKFRGQRNSDVPLILHRPQISKVGPVETTKLRYNMLQSQYKRITRITTTKSEKGGQGYGPRFQNAEWVSSSPS